MNSTRLVQLVLSLGLLIVAHTANALTIHYGDDRHSELVQCDELTYVGEQSDAETCYEQLLENDDPLLAANAAAALGDVRLGNKLFRQAASNSNNPIIKTHWAKLYMETHQISDAVSLYREALLYDDNFLPARLGLVEATMRTYEAKAREDLNNILIDHPGNAHALLLLARLELELQNTDSARSILDSAEASLTNEGKPLLEVYAMRASANLLDDKPIEEYASQALSENPLYGDFYAIVAHFYIITYRYREAIELYQKAVKINPELASAQRDLGINYLRVNNLFAARYHIKKAFDIDPFDAETVNTLRLMDSLDGMRISAVDVPDPADPELSLGRVLIRLDREDADALEPYVKDMSVKAVQEFTERYDFRLKRPMVVELYHDHDDFGVRTVSTPGIGLLGVTFGYLTAMDSPKARPAGGFHWGTTLWHEIAHVFTLEATNHRLPRWFSEGLSVYEEWNTGPLRDRTIGIDTLIAISKGALLPIEELDSGFVRPSYQGQVQVSYTQAGLICDFISKNYGHEALVTMLREFADAKPTSSALMSAIGIDGPTFDALFLEHIENQYGEFARDLDDFQVANRQLGRAVNAEDWISAEIMAKDIIERDPSRVSSGNVYEVLAQAQREQGNDDASTQTLLEWHSRGGHGVASLQILIRALRDQNRIAESAEVIESLNWVNPYSIEEHRWLGDYYLETEQASRAIREYDALLGLRPQDPAVAWLGKAKAQLQIGDADKARRQVLYALESAPFYRDAQKLLLEFNEGESVD